jgi:hypothetical protein
MGRFIVAGLAAALIFASSGAHAEDYRVDFNAKVPGRSDRTWLDLVRQAFPDIKIDSAGADHDATGKIAAPIPMIPKDQEAGGDKSTIDLASLAAARIDIDGKPRWVVLGEQDGFGVAPLMLFDADGAGKLLDIVDAVADMHTSMDLTGPVSLGGGAAVIGVRNWHDNSNESYDDLKLVLIAKDRFSSIHEESAFGERQARLSTSEGLTFSVSPDPGRPLARIDVVLEHQKQRFAVDGQTKVGKPVVTKTRTSLRWITTKAKYERIGQ